MELIKKKLFFTMGSNAQEYIHDFSPANLASIASEGIDVYTFIERSWCFEYDDLPQEFMWFRDNVALLSVDSFESWLASVKKLTHHDPIKRAEKKGVSVRVVNPSFQLASGIWKIYNETPVRQDRGFPYFGVGLDTVANEVVPSNDLFIGAYYEDDLIGFLQLSQGEETLVITQILSLTKHANKSVNKALIAKAVEVCASQGKGWLIYARMGNHPSLDRFKRENGFTEYPITRYYIALSRRGKLALLLHLQRDTKDSLPTWMKNLLYPLYCWVSRIKVGA